MAETAVSEGSLAVCIRELRRALGDDAARDLVTNVYGWFTEGFDTADLQVAKAFFEAPRG